VPRKVHSAETKGRQEGRQEGRKEGRFEPGTRIRSAASSTTIAPSCARSRSSRARSARVVNEEAPCLPARRAAANLRFHHRRSVLLRDHEARINPRARCVSLAITFRECSSSLRRASASADDRNTEHRTSSTRRNSKLPESCFC
jgi:hypothetical protein